MNAQGTVLVCGATGAVGRHVVRDLVRRGEPVRALVRRPTDATWLGDLDVDVVRGDLRQVGAAHRALGGITTVVSAVTALGRYMAGDHSTRIRDVDLRGVCNLVDTAAASGVERFIYVSVARRFRPTNCAVVTASEEVEQRLERSGMTAIIVRSEPYAELWLSPQVGFDPAKGAARIFGRGTMPIRFTSTAGVGAAVAALAVADDPPTEVELAAPEAVSFVEACGIVESITGRRIRRAHIPRVVLRAASTVLRRLQPELASAMALGYGLDTYESRVDESGFAALGITPRPATAYLRDTYGALAIGVATAAPGRML